jgi:4-hydroxy-3-methylbut-2-enyl diphosphate reductase
MKIELDINAGFCFGVKKTIERAESELEQGNSIYCLGEMVHNDEEINRLEKKGLKTIDYEDLRKLKNTRILIRAHGEPPETYQIAKENNLELIDTTCPIVSRLQNRIKTCFDEIVDDKGQIVIYGKEGHAEVVGLVGQTRGKAIVVNKVSDLDQLDSDLPVYLYSQTTKSKKGFNEIKKEIEKRLLAAGKNKKFHLLAHQTICGQVANREPALKRFAKNHDIIFFVSGKKSSNGRMLYEVCKAANPNSFFISNPDEVQKSMIEGAETIGISGATSTPTWLLKDVEKMIRSFVS